MSNAGGGGTGRGPRLPRWTRQEILVLIEGKRVVERSGSGRGRGRGRARGGGEGGGTAGAEPTKWAAVAEYCRRHGVDRGPVQCRKRWSNLAGDYKKIREWERSYPVKKEASFWAMRNDARRERRLPGFFDREVYDILEGRGAGGNAAAAARAEVEDVEVKDRVKTVSEPDSGRGEVAGEGGLFSSSSEDDDDEDDEATTPAPMPTLAPAAVAVPISEKTTEAPRQETSEQGGTSKGKRQEQITGDSPVQCGQKRQRSSDDISGRAGADLQGQLIEILDQSSRMVAAQLEAQNINSRLDREQRKDQVSSLLGVLGKVADALYRIADKL
ncbi:trihelix transcription factor ASR3-like isoform X2 [Phragmites australis]|uniref:trihelix transcription factor ASR3-like isoform X2 n=1 Tax=Phragmites australis TaxID=29695 RepID=UPI002D7A2B38|nr:trihelix transcription factor ASR3-like isoform X2 [Phragmites australis]